MSPLLKPGHMTITIATVAALMITLKLVCHGLLWAFEELHVPPDGWYLVKFLVAETVLWLLPAIYALRRLGFFGSAKPKEQTS